MESKQFLKQLTGISLVTLLSRFFGFIRTVLFAALFGTSNIGDSFFLAFQIPNLFRRFLAEGSLSSAVVPLFNQIPEDQKQERQRFISIVIGILFTLTSIVIFLGVFFSNQLIDFFYWFQEKGQGENAELTSFLLKIMFFYLLFVSLAAICQGVLNSYRFFFISAATPVFFNLFIIAIVTILFFQNFSLKNKTIVIAFAIVAGGAIQFIYSWFFLNRKGYKFIPIFSLKDKWVKSFFVLMLPTFLSASLYQINVFLVQPIALSLGEGRVSALFYSNRLIEMPLGIISVSIATVSLTNMTSCLRNNENKKFLQNIQQGINVTFLLLIPIVILLFLQRENILSLLFERNNFNEQSLFLSSSCLYFHVFSIPFVALHRLISNVFYAYKEHYSILIISAVGIVINLFFCYFLTKSMGLDIKGIALASLISFVVMTLISFFYLDFKFKHGLTVFTVGKIFVYFLLLLFPTSLFLFLKKYINFESLLIHFHEKKIIQFLEIALFSGVFLGCYFFVLFFYKKVTRKKI